VMLEYFSVRLTLTLTRPQPESLPSREVLRRGSGSFCSIF
jgi:hypothetical protein